MSPAPAPGPRRPPSYPPPGPPRPPPALPQSSPHPTQPNPSVRAVRRPVWLLPAAGVWSAALIAAALLVSPSLVEVNGPKVLVPVSAPLVVVVMVSLALAVARRRRSRWPTVVAWVLAGLLDCLALVGMLTIGVFLLPAAIAVTVACAMP